MRRGPGHRRRVPPWAEGPAWVVLASCGTASAAWALGQAIGDRWVWSQALYWTPAWGALGAALVGLGAASLLPPGRRARVLGTWIMVAAALLSSARFLRWELGWAVTGFPSEGSGLTVTHWNPQWPGQAALESGRALSSVLGDVTIVSNPGSILRSAVADDWVPAGWEVRDLGHFALVSRLPVVECRVLLFTSVPRVGLVWLGWVEVESPGAGRIGILVADLPSNPRLARGTVAEALTELMPTALGGCAPDLVVGDLNSTPGSLVWAAVAPGMEPAPPWRSRGWMATFKRPWPMLRIDAALAGPRLRWRRAESVDLGIGEHRAQRCAFDPVS